jgi:hypothetical protein
MEASTPSRLQDEDLHTKKALETKTYALRRL